ncbi:fumarylacetoacetate hydrolase family protein [Tirmania nivea]|nr:fumarylacetoacetate hydrolase family protein [Tirmania nivea]
MRPTAPRHLVAQIKKHFPSPPAPRTIVCIGRNYADHIAELGNTRPAEPLFFLKPVRSLLLPQFHPLVLMPKGCDLHYEVELAVVLGKQVDEWKGGLRDLENVVAGYKVAIDMTARNYQSAAKEKGLPWALAKGLKSFCPISRFIPIKDIPDPHNVQLHLEVNGEKRQEDFTSLMLFDIPRLLRHVSSVMPLGPGDLLLTGTPKGAGRVMPGDKITAGVRVDGQELDLGKIKVKIVERVGGYGSDQDKEVIEKGPEAIKKEATME